MGPPAQEAASSSSPSGGSSGRSSRRGPRLERRNASKHIPYQYDTELYCSYPPSSPPPPARPSPSSKSAPALACTVDLSSFRIGGSGDGGGDVQLLCRNLGLSGPDEFAISLTDWEAHKAYRSSSSSSASSSPSSRSQRDRPLPRESPLRPDAAEVLAFSLAADSELPAKKTAPIEAPARPAWLDPQEPPRTDTKKLTCEGGIKGIRPPPVMLKPPPSMALPQSLLVGSTWDILQSFAPDDQGHAAPTIRSARDFAVVQDAEDDDDEAEVLTLDDLRLGDTSEEFTGMSSISTTNDDETVDSMFYISPNGRFKRKIRSWSRGMLLGSGSFGTVYEGISE
jgi:mitogen-activated protein kinase kinase kinase 1